MGSGSETQLKVGENLNKIKGFMYRNVLYMYIHMSFLQTIEPLTFSVERTPTPPFYRLTSLKKQPATIADADDFSQFSHLDKGQIHTKRHSGEDPTKADE